VVPKQNCKPIYCVKKESDEMTAQGEEVSEGFLIGEDVITSVWKQKSAKINLEIQCRLSE